MGIKILWVGLTWLLAVVPFIKMVFPVNVFVGIDILVLVGAIIMIIGCVMYWMDK